MPFDTRFADLNTTQKLVLLRKLVDFWELLEGLPQAEDDAESMKRHREIDPTFWAVYSAAANSLEPILEKAHDTVMREPERAGGAMRTRTQRGTQRGGQ